MSLPKARNISPKISIMPISCITIRNLSLGFRPVIISYKVNTICPPSRAGIGSRFMTARIMEIMARMFMNTGQFHCSALRL